MIKKSEIPSTTFGLYPFTVVIFKTILRPTADSKFGTSVWVYVNKETGVVVRYSSSHIRFFNMTDPVDNAEYWAGRARTKAAFSRMMGWRK
jgi:hypothetical protein